MGMNVLEISIAISSNKEETQKDFNDAVNAANSIIKKHDDWFVNVIAPSVEDFNKKTILLQVYYEYNETTSVDEFHVEPTHSLKEYGLEVPTEEEKDYVYVVHWNQVWDCDLIADDCKVFCSKEKAIAYFKGFKEDEFDSINEKGVDDWVENEENFIDEEDGNAKWEYYKDFEADTDHSYIYCEKKEVE